MTLTQAIREALDKLEWAYDNINSDREYFERNLLSVVAAEEGRKYEALIKLVQEWQSASLLELCKGKATLELKQATAALVQWEAK